MLRLERLSGCRWNSVTRAACWSHIQHMANLKKRWREWTNDDWMLNSPVLLSLDAMFLGLGIWAFIYGFILN